MQIRKLEEIYKYFPSNIYRLLQNTTEQNYQIEQELQEIRIRAERPIILKLRNVELVIEYQVNQTEILQTVEKLCNNSIYAYKNQICEGFITVKGGHRIRYNRKCSNRKRKNNKYEIHYKFKF